MFLVFFYEAIWLIVYVLMVFLLILHGYWFFISLFGLKNPLFCKDSDPEKLFAILVPAHNEERVIGELLDNLNKLDYPKSKYDVYVIADNCSDSTASIAREKKAIVLEHFYEANEPRGKPYAIAWAIKKIPLEKYDAIVFFDADNLVTINFLRAMNNRLITGARLIQAYLDTKNPEDNWITLGYNASFCYANRAWQVSRSRLGLGAAIGGTGFCVDISLLNQIGWKARTLTEDLEFQIQALLIGVKAEWCHEARVFDEKPLSFKTSCVQRLRWARGHWQVFGKYFFPLLLKAVRELNISAFDGCLFLLNPGKIVLNAVTSIILFIQLLVDYFWNEVMWWPDIFPWQLWLMILIFQIAYVIWAVRIDTKVKKFSVIPLIILNMLYLPISVWAFLTLKNRRWKKTTHTRNISLKELKE